MADEQTGAVGGNEDGSKSQASGPMGDTPATAGNGKTKVSSGAAEKSEGRLNPSSPGNTGTTPGTVSRLG